MARSSGRVKDAPGGEFLHARSGVRYRVNQNGFEFRRATDRLEGRRRLDFFIGSGAAGRSYLYQKDGFLFQAPVSWFAQPRRWDVSPGFERDERMNLTRPIEKECLRCHAGRLQPVEGAQNRYQDPPFLEDGVGCERCHGPGAAHAAGAREIVNPAKLAPERRDSVCAPCHLTGEERVEKAGRGLETFLPGDVLADFATSFVWAGGGRSALRVTSHYEKLWQSRCRQAGGDRLWCGSCHEVHRPPARAERGVYFRRKCQGCHASVHPEGRAECTSCHMPAGAVIDAAHTVYTDHSIPRLRGARGPAPPPDRELVGFWGAAGPREAGLAYLRIASRQSNAAHFVRAFELLRQAEAAGASDAKVLTQLAFLHDRAGDEASAAGFYERAFAADSAEVDAAVNLGAILLKRGRASDAIRLWEAALRGNAGLEAAGLNLAMTYLRVGNRAAAREALRKVLDYNPDSPQARRLLLQ